MGSFKRESWVSVSADWGVPYRVEIFLTMSTDRLTFSEFLCLHRGQLKINVTYLDLPVCSAFPARMIVSVLTTGHAVQVKLDLDVVGSGPSDSFVEVCQLAGYERFSFDDIECPVPNGDSYVIQAIL